MKCRNTMKRIMNIENLVWIPEHFRNGKLIPGYWRTKKDNIIILDTIWNTNPFLIDKPGTKYLQNPAQIVPFTQSPKTTV